MTLDGTIDRAESALIAATAATGPAPPSGVAGLAALALAEAALKSAAEPCAVPVAGQTAVWDSL
jgi:hypothetical protein